MSIRQCLLSILLCTAIVLSAGCGSVQQVLDSLDKPTARVRGVKLRDLKLRSVSLDFDIEVTNPYDVALPLVNVDYALASGGEPFVSGKGELTGSIPARGSKRLTLPADVRFDQLIAALRGVKAGQVVPYAAELGLAVDAPGLGPLRLPMRKSGELPVPAVPKVELAEVSWSKLSLTGAAAVVKLKVENTNAFPLDLSTLDFKIALGGTEFADVKLGKKIALSKGGSGSIDIPIQVSTLKLGVAAVNMLKAKSIDYRVNGSVKGGTPYGRIDLPFDQGGKTAMSH